ncbi:MAG TPA: hypothetical protein VIH40_12425 [Xanthobacteraceae bacterium]
MAGLDFDVRSNIGALAGRLADFSQKRVPFATVYALTKTAQDIRAAEYTAMRAAFDRPTPFTLNSLRVQPATKQLPIASVEFKDGFGSTPAWRYLGPQIEGGPRVKKSHERALERAGILRSDEFCVPGKLATLDAYGNMPGSQITRILSDVQANPDPLSNTNAKGRHRRWKRGKGVYFVAWGGRSGLPRGIYFRLGLRAIRPMLLFVKQPRYAARLPFRPTAEATFHRRFDVHFNEGFLRYGLPPALPRVA